MEDETIAYACVPGAGGDDAIVCLRPHGEENFPEYLKQTFCNGRSAIAVLPVTTLNQGETAL